jgi:hypothetical protein
MDLAKVTSFSVLLLLLIGCGRSHHKSEGASTSEPLIDPSIWGGTKQIGVASGYTHGIDVAVDNDDNVYVTGTSDGNLDGNTKTGNRDIFVTKYTPTGTKLWTRLMGAAGIWLDPLDIAADYSGNSYVTGKINAGLDGNTQMGSEDLYLIKYDTSGVKQWTKQLGVATKYTVGRGVTADPLGNVYVTGNTNGDLDGESRTGTSHEMFLVKYNNSGVKQWTRLLGAGTSITFGEAVTLDINNDIYVGGYTRVGLDGNTLNGDIDFFVTKYDPSGVRQWTRQLGAVPGTIAQGKDIITDLEGNVFVAGITNGSLDGNTLSASGWDSFITKYSSSGVKQWTRQLSDDTGSIYGESLGSDSLNNIYIAGRTEADLNGTLTGTYDAFVAKYNSAGSRVWVQQFGFAGLGMEASGIAVNRYGSSYITGETMLGLAGNTMNGNYDAYVLKYDNLGVTQ